MANAAKTPVQRTIDLRGKTAIEQLRTAYGDRLAAIRNGVDPATLTASAARIRDLEAKAHEQRAALSRIPDTALYLG